MKILTPQEHWAAWFDFDCRCGFPHPKAGKHGPPPEVVEIDGKTVLYPRYPGVMGNDEPVPRS